MDSNYVYCSVFGRSITTYTLMSTRDCLKLLTLCDLTYKRWTSKIYTKWKEARKKGEETAIPKEFLKRKGEWKYLQEHFKSERFLRNSAANKANRDKHTLHHHVGPVPLGYKLKRSFPRRVRCHMLTYGNLSMRCRGTTLLSGTMTILY